MKSSKPNKPTKHGPMKPKKKGAAKPKLSRPKAMDKSKKPKSPEKSKPKVSGKPKPKAWRPPTLRTLAQENPVRFQETFERAMYFTRQRMGRPSVSGNSPGDFVADALTRVIDVPIKHSALNLLCMVAARAVYKRKLRDRHVTNYCFAESPSI